MNIHVVKQYEIVLSFNIKDNYIFPCLHNIKLSYNILKCFSALSIRMRMPTYNSKHGSFLLVKSNENTHPNVQSCPYNKERE